MCAFFGAVCAFCHVLARACPCRVRSICTCMPGHYSGRSTQKPFARTRGPSSAQCAWVYKHHMQHKYPQTKTSTNIHATCTRQTHYAYNCYLRLAIYVMPSVIGGGYHCMCGNTLTIPHAPSLFFFIRTPTDYLAAQIGCSRCAHHLITLKYTQIILFLQLTLGLRVRVVPGFQSCVRHQACVLGLQTGA